MEWLLTWVSFCPRCSQLQLVAVGLVVWDVLMRAHTRICNPSLNLR